jgi:hypothetical protein
MALRFAIIKDIKTQVGNHEESVVYEYDEDQVIDYFLDNVRLLLPEKKDPIFGERKWTRPEITAALDGAWKKTIADFKKVTIRIL